jgi:ElaB/YqjD/DUF883 family membrane-anchored ribosome-binding protein
MGFERVNETDNKENAESRKAEAEKKIEDFDNRIDSTVRAHGEMLKRRTDLSPDEKNELQTEITENAKKQKAEFREGMEKTCPELKEGKNEMSRADIEKEKNKIGDEL